MGQREDLEELRQGLLEAFYSADVAVKAQIAGQLRLVVKELAELGGAVVEESMADEIAARRTKRAEAGAPGPADPASAPRRGQSRRSSGRHRSG